MDLSQRPPSRLNPTLASLPMTGLCLSELETVEAVADRLELAVEAPGVLVTRGGEPLAVISRERLVEQIAGRFGFALHQRRAIGQLADRLGSPPLVFAADTLIKHAARQALDRDKAFAFDAIVVKCEDGQYRLIDSHDLLQAQTQLMAIAYGEIETQKVIAEQANAAKGRFLATVSHEIRTPMNGILGISELLCKTKLNDSQTEFVEMIRGSAETLLVVINDLLDVSKIEAKRMHLENAPIDLRAIIQQTMGPLKLQAEAKGLTVSTQIDANIPAILLGDSIRIRQVFTNLVSNAIKFTESGSIDISVCLLKQIGKRVVLHGTVKDTGIGIASDRRDAIFEAFEQADGSTTRRFGGTGLGLSICRSLIELMNGSIGVESDGCNGSSFWFDIRLEEGQPSESLPPGESADRSSTMPALKILLAEDNLVNQRVAHSLLTGEGHHVTIVENGKAAVEAVSGGDFDCVLMDVQMPILDGIAATALIRADERTRDQPAIPIIAMTAGASADDRQRCLDVGMTGYIAKPIRFPELIALLANIRPNCHQDRSNLGGDCSVASNQVDLRFDNAHQGLVDWGLLRQLTKNRPDMLRNLVAAISKEAPQELKLMNEAALANDAPTIQRAAHKLRGALGYFGALPMKRLLGELEQLAREGDVGRCRERITELDSYWRSVQCELNGLDSLAT